jgi:hypothetical protein
MRTPELLPKVSKAKLNTEGSVLKNHKDNYGAQKLKWAKNSTDTSDPYGVYGPERKDTTDLYIHSSSHSLEMGSISAAIDISFNNTGRGEYAD